MMAIWFFQFLTNIIWIWLEDSEQKGTKIQEFHWYIKLKFLKTLWERKKERKKKRKKEYQERPS